MKIIFVLLLSFSFHFLHAQNSLTGDGFGGRFWYTSHNLCAGSYSAYSICGDSDQLFGWGDNDYGQLGNGTTLYSDTPVKVIGMTHTRYYSAGYIQAAIKSDNTAWIWGLGPIPYWPSGFSSIPVQVLSDVKFVHAGYTHIVFVKNDGTVWGVGYNDFGELGTGSTTLNPIITPVQMDGITNAVRAIAVGSTTKNASNAPNPATIILLADGTVEITGGGDQFQSTNSLIPVPIPGLKNIVDIKGNHYAAFALDSSGNVYGFGKDNPVTGTIGIGTIDPYTFYPPTKIIFPPGASSIVAISCTNDGDNAMALDANHNVYAWGLGILGSNGTGSTANQYTPVLVATNTIDIFTGESFSYILKDDNTLWATGNSKYKDVPGYLGNYYGSIWMNLSNNQRDTFTKLSPALPPMNLCAFKPFGSVKACPISANIISKNVLNCSGSFFQLPSGKNISTAGTYYDTIRTLLGCDSLVTKINLSVSSISYNNQSATICSGSQYQLPSGIYASNSGTYFDTTKSSFGCDSLITKTNLNVYPVSSSDITDSFSLGQTYTLPSGEVVNTPGNYQYILKDVNGCDSIIHISLSAKSTAGCVRPVKAFTPNGDGINDVWKIFTEGCVKRTEVSVYNRWGSKVYYSENYHNDWDGNYKHNRLPDGTYYYIVNVTLYNDNKVELTGNVTIMR